MADTNDLDASLSKVELASADCIAAVGVLISEMTKAFSRLLQKIAEGAPDLSAEVARINSLTQTLSDTTDKVNSAVAQAKVEGV